MYKYKLTIILTIMYIFLGISFAKIDLEEALNPSTPANTYDKLNQYNEEKIKESYQKAYKTVGGYLGSNQSDLQAIQNGHLSKCIKIFDKLGIKKKGGEYDENDFLNCQDKIDKMIDDYVKSDTNNQSVEDSTKGENILADGDETNGPYDLIADMKNINKMLFKDEIEINPKFDNGDDNGGNDNNNGNNNSKDGNNNGDGNGGNNNNNGNNENNDGNNNGGNNNNNNNGGNDNNNGNNNSSEKDFYQTPRLQFGNTCSRGLDFGQREKGNGDGNNNGGNQNTGDNGDGFDTFHRGDKNTSGGFIDIGSSDNSNGYINGGYYSGGNWDEIIFSGDNGGGGGGGGSCPPENYILAICVKLVPTGPKGPVGGTVKKRSMEEIIGKISDTLKDMKDNFIVLVGHGDEALDIDLKHVSFSDTYAIGLVLNKKPVFDFKPDPESKKQENEADTIYKGVPRKLVKMMKDSGVGNGFSKDADRNKYLFTNTDYIKPNKRVNNNAPEKVDSSSDEGVFTLENRFSDFVDAYSNSMDNMITTSKKIKSSALNLLRRSEVEY